MEPPSYEEARFHPAAQGRDTLHFPPPPTYDASLARAPTPPPTYGEAVTVQPNPFPVLIVPSVPTAATSPQQNNGVTLHPHTQIGVHGRQARSGVIMNQPPPVPIAVTYLRDSPGYVCCPYCQRLVTTKVTYMPGRGAWCMCVLLTFMGLICGFCLIPLMIRGLQDVHHSCPHCGNTLHIFLR